MTRETTGYLFNRNLIVYMFKVGILLLSDELDQLYGEMPVIVIRLNSNVKGGLEGICFPRSPIDHHALQLLYFYLE